MKEICLYEEGKDSLVAVFEGNKLIECHIESEHFSSLVGNIYKGKIRRVVPELDAAFVDIGTSKSALLDVRDIVDRANGKQPTQKITDLVKEGTIVWVQVIKDAVTTKEGLVDKGVRVSTKLKIESPYFIYFSQGRHIGASKEIDNVEMRNQRIAELRDWMQSEKKKGGCIIRTAAFDLAKAQYLTELEALFEKVTNLFTAKREATRVGLIFEPLNSIEKVLNAYSGVSFNIISNEDSALCVKSILQEKEFYSQVSLALKPIVNLESGVSLVIETTEALTSIDVNTGPAIEQGLSVLDVNLEALGEILRQIILRRLSGAIFVDFINMEQKDKQSFNSAIDTTFAGSKNVITVHGVTQLGFMELSVKRTSASLSEMSQFASLLFANKH